MKLSFTSENQNLGCSTNHNTCEILNEKKPEINYDKLYNGNLRSQIEVFRKMKTNLERRNQIRSNNVKHVKSSFLSPCEFSGLQNVQIFTQFWTLRPMNYQKIFDWPNIPIIFSKLVRNHWMHVFIFFHVCSQSPEIFLIFFKSCTLNQICLVLLREIL